MSNSNPCGNPRTVSHPPTAAALLPGQRAATYQDLAHLYRTPSWEQVQGALDQVLLKYPKFLLDNKDAHFHPVRELERHEKESYRLGLESFQAEYVRLFVNSREGVSAPPHASFYTEGSLFGQAAQEALTHYRRFGITPDASENEPPDHICYELEFLSFLCAIEQEALDQGRQEDADGLRKAQADFLVNHLLPWANRFCDRIVENADLAYYRLVGAFTKGFLAHDATLMEDKRSTQAGGPSTVRAKGTHVRPDPSK
jgi:DMSO reductase family type II enzyme chaperone